MTGRELLEIMARSHRRSAVVGTPENGIIAGLDLEGRLFAVLNGRVLNRVVPEAIEKQSDRRVFRTPGGDALWPGPEGTRFGYEYATGAWRVPPGITGAVWLVQEQTGESLVMEAEVDLINSRGLGIPVLLRREISAEAGKATLTQRVTETIRYLGAKTLEAGEFLLIPWSLCQFDWGGGCHYRFPVASNDDVWDLYAPSDDKRRRDGEFCVVQTETRERFQLAIGPGVPWVEYRFPGFFRVRRSVEGDISGRFADIADADPASEPSGRGIKLSVYCDPVGFTEVEACGGSLDRLAPGDETRVTIVNHYELEE